MFNLGNSFTLNDLSLSSGAEPFNFIWVNPGVFTLGKALNSTGTGSYHELQVSPINVSFSQGFWVAKYPVTQAHWQAVGNLPLEALNWYENLPEEKKEKYDNLPVWRDIENLPLYWCNWIEAVQYCRLLNLRYKDDLPTGYHFSLPTEAQWEYVCKTGTDYDPPYNHPINNISNHSLIPKVGQQTPTAWGFHDMLACVHQMCFDFASEFFDTDIEYFKEERPYPYEGVDTFIDFFPMHYTEEETEVLNLFAYHRVVKSGLGTAICREKYHVQHRFHDSGFEPPLGFRVALRPITSYDLNDPVLTSEGINILGD